LAVLASLEVSAFLCTGHSRDQSFDSHWRFLRGETAGAEDPAFDDSEWRILDLPHDWSIEDLPPRTNRVLELRAVTGTWRFHQGDDARWKARDLDDSQWQHVILPDSWEHHSGYTNNYAYGWYRRHLEIPAEFKGSDFYLLLGRIDDVDEVWLNGELLGGTGSYPPDYRTAFNDERRYLVPASIVRGDNSDLLAVRVFDGENGGGLLEEGRESARLGPFDTAESQGGHFTGYTVGGVGWYRKHFTVNETNKLVAVRFDGVYMNAEVWINGHRLGEQPHGYTSFEFDLTPYINSAGQENVLAVRVRNEGRNSRWYSGSGIYRHVWLTVREPVHIPTWGVFVTTPEVSSNKAVVNVSSEVRNAGASDAEAIVRVSVMDDSGEIVGTDASRLALPPGKATLITQHVTVLSPRLWSSEAPNLYSARVEIVMNEQTADVVSELFGIRKIEFDAEHGFRLNGEPTLLKGGNVHHDNGPLGSMAIDRAEERKVELLKANGFNAVRTSHNPPSPAFLKACDRLGMVAIVEAFDQWNESKENNQQDYHRFFNDWWERDIASMVRRDRNHPSVIMWSIGNEIPEQFRAGDTGMRLREAVLLHDTTRPVTQAICNDWGRVTRNWNTLSDPAFVHLDVAGYNYLPEKYESDHARHPERVMYGSESYPKDALLYWSYVERHPYVIGDFVWSAMDYLGEAGIAHALLSNEPNSFFMSWPWFNAWCGDLDLCGFKKPQSYYRDVVWHRSPIEMAVQAPIPPDLTETMSSWAWPNESRCWNWSGHEGTPLQVSVYSRCEKVRLTLNDRVIGEQTISEATQFTARFDVPYDPGELSAYGLIDGKVMAQTTLKTTGMPKKVKLAVDRTSIRADRNDLSYVTVEVVDADGQRVPDATIPVRISVSGKGELVGHASAVPNEPASFREPMRTTFEGRCLAILRPTGETGDISLRVEAEGLEPATTTIGVESLRLASGAPSRTIISDR